MGCVNGWHHLENAYKRGNHTARIMNAHVEYAQDDNYVDGYEIYTIFVMVDGSQTQLPSHACEVTTDPEVTAPASPSPYAGAQAATPPPSNPARGALTPNKHKQETRKRKAHAMNNSNNRNWAIEYATKLTERAAGLTIMTVIETAWNNLTPSQQQDILDAYGREDYAAVGVPLDGPLTPHLTSEDWWDKDYGEENPALQQYLTEIGTNLTRLNANPKQIGGLWDDTDSTYVYSPSTTSTATSPTPPRLSNTRSATSRTSYAAQPPATTRTSETIFRRRGVDETPARRLHL